MTIKDLAAQTGYSVGTVSRVLNNQPHVSELLSLLHSPTLTSIPDHWKN